MAGQGYGPHVLPFIFDLVSIVNYAQLAQNKRGKKEELVPEDQDGSGTIKFAKSARDGFPHLFGTSFLAMFIQLYTFIVQMGFFSLHRC